MKGYTPWIIAAGIGYLIYKANSIVNAAQQLTFNVVKIALVKSQSNILYTQLAVTLRITNPTRQVIAFDHFQGQMSLRQQVVAEARTSQAVDLPANSITDIIFPVSISNLTTLLTLKDVIATWITSGVKELVSFKGTLYAGGVSIPVDTSINVSIDKQGNVDYGGKAAMGYLNGVPKEMGLPTLGL